MKNCDYGLVCFCLFVCSTHMDHCVLSNILIKISTILRKKKEIYKKKESLQHKEKNNFVSQFY